MHSKVPDLKYPLRYATRLPGYDYSQANHYFVTICVFDRAPILGTIKESDFVPSALGEIVSETWRSIPDLFLGAQIDYWVVMPNHFHGIVVLAGNEERGSRAASTVAGVKSDDVVPRVSLARVIGGFKSISAKLINRDRGSAGAKVWQRSYYDHVIRDRRDLDAKRTYIRNNPMKWALDEENPESEAYKVSERRRGSRAA
jgi:REP element-mobilizing transposase RayT